MPRVFTIGAMDQWVDWQRNEITPVTLTGLTSVGGVATATTAAAHHLETDDEVEIAGANQSAYNGRAIITATSATTFTFPVSGAPASPATGTITVAYLGDAHGGRRDRWASQGMLAAEVYALSGWERLQAQAVQAGVNYRVRLYRIAITAADRLVWGDVVLQILGVMPLPDQTFIECDCTTEAD